MKAARHEKERDRLLRRLSGRRCTSDLTDASTSSSNNNAPPHDDAYMEEGATASTTGREHQKGKWTARKW